jgi:C-terminal processing protease CtpA/Prc
LLPSLPSKSANRGVGIDRIAWIEVAAFKEDIGSTPKVKSEQKILFAESLQDVLRAQDAEGACGWIVDLRNNSGGNMWPMLLGLAPLLSNDGGSATTVGHFSTAAGPQSWEVQPNSVALMGRQILKLNGSGYRLRHQNRPVAVLLGRSTASSGEAMGLAFRGSSRFRSFGQRTAGYSTGNRPVPLADGSFLLLTETVMLDRKAEGNAGAIVPEVEFDSDKEAEASARSWLLSRASCRRISL